MLLSLPEGLVRLLLSGDKLWDLWGPDSCDEGFADWEEAFRLLTSFTKKLNVDQILSISIIKLN